MGNTLRKQQNNIINMVKLKKNFLPSMLFEKLSKHLNGDNFAWYFNESSMDDTKAPFIRDDDFLFTHNLFTPQ